MIPFWAYAVATAFWTLWFIRRARLRRSAQIVHVTEGRHRPLRGGGF